MSNGIFSVIRLETAYVPWDWTFARDQAARIDSHWAERVAEKPKLWDGRVLLLRSGEIVAAPDGLVFRGAFFETNFRNFLAWRDFGFPDTGVFNCFAMAALRSNDGAFLLGEAGSHTMNAGSIYFAAGTPDRNDIVGENVDLAGSVFREMAEETGFTAQDTSAAPGWRIVVDGQKIACMRALRLDLSAAEACARVDAFIAADPDPELARLHAVHGVADIDPANMPVFIQTYLRDVLADELAL